MQLILVLHLDFFINCCLIGLMFSWNKAIYKRLCGSCILCCFSRMELQKEAKWRQKTIAYVKNERSDAVSGSRNLQIVEMQSNSSPSAVSRDYLPSPTAVDIAPSSLPSHGNLAMSVSISVVSETPAIP